MNLKNLHIGARLGIGFAVVLAISILLTGLSIWRLQVVAEATRTMMQQPLTKERLLSDYYRLLFGGVRITAAVAKSADPSLPVFFAEDSKAGITKAQAIRKELEPLFQTEQEKGWHKKLGDISKTYGAAREAISQAKKNGQTNEADRILNKEFIPIANSYMETLQGLVTEQRKNIDKMADHIEDIYRSSRNLLIVLELLAVAFGVVCAWLLTVGITRPLRTALNVAQTVASGDLTSRIEVKTTDETGQLLQALKVMNENLLRIISDVRGGTEIIATASNQIASGSLDLSSRTEQQASSLEETTSSMEELTSAVKQNADNASQANGLAMTAFEVAGKGGQVVSQVVETMGSINESSKKIIDIIGVIDGIAFQTNILALNAAVEAARAGEQGRGFAVVASEVRGLAQRSAAAAKEIKVLIDNSVEKVDFGSKLVNQAGSTMDEIVASIQRVTDIMGEITAATEGQNTGIEQINRAITEMEDVAQQNAALVEEASAAAQMMQDQAANLSQAVNIFKLNGVQAISSVN